MQENKVDSAALGYFVVCRGAFENTQVIEPQLVERALVIPRDHQCAHKPSTEHNRPLNSGAHFKLICAFEGVLGKVLVMSKRSGTKYLESTHFGITSVIAQTLHEGKPNTSLRLAYNLETACGAQANRKNPSSWGARKGTGDTKTKWYCLGSTHFGITLGTPSTHILDRGTPNTHILPTM